MNDIAASPRDETRRESTGAAVMVGGKVRLAVVQFDPVPNDPLVNLAKARAFVRQAAQRSFDLVVFPEYFLHSVLPHDKAHEIIGGEARRWLDDLREMAREEGIDVVTGTVVEKGEAASVGDPNKIHGVHVSRLDEGGLEDEKDVTEQRLTSISTEPTHPFPLLNNAYYISHTGEVIGSYTKKNLWHPERAYLTPGVHPHLVFDVVSPRTKTAFRAGLLVCWDLAFPEMFRELVAQDVDIILIPTCWYATDATPLGLAHNPKSETVFLDNMVVARAYENEACVVMCNVGGPGPKSGASPSSGAESEAIGRSAVAMPFLGPVVRAEGPEEQVLWAEVDLRVVEDARNVYKVREDLRLRTTATTA